MRKTTILILTLCLLAAAAGCGAGRVAEKHTIPYPEEYPSHQDELGADAFAELLDDPDSVYYTAGDYYNAKSGGTLHILEHFETYQQTTEYTCGAASARMVLHHFGEDGYDEMQLAAQMTADETHGITVEGVRDFFGSIGWTVEAHADTGYYFESFEDFIAYTVEKIDGGVPVMVNWEDWGGHWQVIVGIDTASELSAYDDVLILADPYDVTDHCQDGYYVYPAGRFFSMWREGACTANAVPYEQPFVTVQPSVK